MAHRIWSWEVWYDSLRSDDDSFDKKKKRDNLSRNYMPCINKK